MKGDSIFLHSLEERPPCGGAGNADHAYQLPFLGTKQIGLINNFLLACGADNLVFPLLDLGRLRSVRGIEGDGLAMRKPISTSSDDDWECTYRDVRCCCENQVRFSIAAWGNLRCNSGGQAGDREIDTGSRAPADRSGSQRYSSRTASMQVDDSRRSRETKISTSRGGIELNVQDRVKFNHIGGCPVLMVEKIKETYTCYSHRNIGSLKGRCCAKVGIKLCSCAGDLGCERARCPHTGGRRNLCHHRIPLLIHQHKMVVGVAGRPGFQFVISQCCIHDDNRGLGGSETVVLGKRIGWLESDKVQDICGLWIREIHAARIAVRSSLYRPSLNTTTLSKSRPGADETKNQNAPRYFM